jgi:hypothetical protein
VLTVRASHKAATIGKPTRVLIVRSPLLTITVAMDSSGDTLAKAIGSAVSPTPVGSQAGSSLTYMTGRTDLAMASCEVSSSKWVNHLKWNDWEIQIHRDV